MGKVGISGTSYIPPIPNESEVRKKIAKILLITNDTLRALELMAYIMKNQIFWDVNKRTAILIANKILISNGRGLLSIPIDKIEKFNDKLNKYYTYDEKTTLFDFTFYSAISGLE